MRILTALTYYRPHLSGLTLHTQRLMEGLAARGHEVTVLTSRYNRELPCRESQNRVTVVRVPVTAHVGKGVLMAGYALRAWQLVKHHDVVVLNMPITPVEAVCITALARKYRRPVIGVYHCDLCLPGFLGPVWDRLSSLGHQVAARYAHRLITLTDDYAAHSPFLKCFPDKTSAIPPPITLAPVDPARVAALRRRIGTHGPLFGFAARFAAEKGIEYLLEAMALIRRTHPEARLLLVGDPAQVVGEHRYRQRLQPLLDRHSEMCCFLGVLDDADLTAFFAICDATTLPSVNSTEGYGMVQAESMLCGTPVVASDLPGVRIPVRATQMGLIVPPRNAEALAQALLEIAQHRVAYIKPPAVVREQLGLDHALNRHESLLQDALAQQAAAAPPGDKELSLLLGQYLRHAPPFLALVRSVEGMLVRRAGPLEAPVLDLGCGDGLFAGLTLTEPVDAGVDRDPRALLRAGNLGRHHKLILAEAGSLPCANATFRTVLSNSVLEHVPDIDQALREIFRVLQPGGRLLLSSPSHRFGDMLLGSRVLSAFNPRLGQSYALWFNWHSHHYHTDSPTLWIKRLAEVGFEVSRWQYYLSPQAHRAFDAAHYLSLPRGLSRILTGRWVSIPVPLTNALLHRWLYPLACVQPSPEGPYLFMDIRKPGGA
ncbi:MAG: glycosyltransferase [bacterium]